MTNWNLVLVYIKDSKQEVKKSKTSWMTIHVLPIYKNGVFRDLFVAEGLMFLILATSLPPSKYISIRLCIN